MTRTLDAQDVDDLADGPLTEITAVERPDGAEVAVVPATPSVLYQRDRSVPFTPEHTAVGNDPAQFRKLV